MTAIQWDVRTVVLPEPVPLFEQRDADIVNSTISFRVEDNPTISTLSDRSPQLSPDGVVPGLLYVPDLNASDPCANLSSQFLPQNVTRQNNIPNADQYPLIAIAPWTSDHPECALPFIRATEADRSQGLVFFPTRPDAAIATPVWDTPDWAVNKSTWREWVLNTEYPIWAIPPDFGAALVQEMGKYSGNVTVSPFGSELAQDYPPEDAVRLFMRVGLNSSKDTNSVLGRLWVFAILILASLCLLTGLTSLIMHIKQRRRRRDLRRRIGNGDVDLEALGIKRQKVPPKVVDRMPLYVYTSKMAPLTTTSTTKESKPSSQPLFAAQRKNLPRRDVPFSQNTCPICLDDFEHDDTVVRELPCQHIFHPECVDEFLRTNSSLCPMCKKSALPIGYCPDNITTSMVRRERAIRRMQETGTDSTPLFSNLPAPVQRYLPAWLLRVRSRPRQGAERPYRSNVTPWSSHQPDTSTITPNQPNPSPRTTTTTTTTPAADLELGTLDLHPTTELPLQPSLEDLPPEIQALSPQERRQWGRQRLAATLPATHLPAEEDQIHTTRMRWFRRGWKKMFPT